MQEIFLITPMPMHVSLKIRGISKQCLLTAIARLSIGTRSSFMLILCKRRQKVWTACCCCPPCLTTLMDMFRVQKASITATQTTDFLLDLSDGICTVHVGSRGDSSSKLNFMAKQSWNFLLVRVLV